jgi:hypothetical protein
MFVVFRHAYLHLLQYIQINHPIRKVLPFLNMVSAHSRQNGECSYIGFSLGGGGWIQETELLFSLTSFDLTSHKGSRREVRRTFQFKLIVIYSKQTTGL